MKLFLQILLVILISFLGAVAHERDLYRVCRQDGESGYAGWFNDFKCSEMKLHK